MAAEDLVMSDKNRYNDLQEEIGRLKAEIEILDGKLLHLTGAHMALRDCAQAITNLLSDEDEEFAEEFLAECKRIREENLEDLRERARLN